MRKRFLFSALIIIVVLTSIIAFVVYSDLNNYNPDNSPGVVNITVAPTKSYYLQGEEINFTIHVNNEQNRPIVYPTLIYYLIRQNESIIYELKEYANFPAGQIPTFPAHSEKVITYVWNQKINVNGTIVQVQPGNYTFTISFNPIGDYGLGGNCSFEIKEPTS